MLGEKANMLSKETDEKPKEVKKPITSPNIKSAADDSQSATEANIKIDNSDEEELLSTRKVITSGDNNAQNNRNKKKRKHNHNNNNKQS